MLRQVCGPVALSELMPFNAIGMCRRLFGLGLAIGATNIEDMKLSVELRLLMRRDQ